MMETTDGEWQRLETGYRSNAEARAFLQERMARGGRLRRVGTSALGRPIEAWEWTLGPPRAEAPRLLLLSLLHPMEWVAREIHLSLLNDLLDGRCDVPAGTRIVSLVDANPDGTARVEAALRSRRPTWVRGNARGVDLNRNFPVDFRSRPAWIEFWPMWRPGPGPLSEPESQAVLEAAELDAPGPILTLSLHAFGRWFFHPPSSHRDRTALAECHERIVTRALTSAPAPGYRYRSLGRYARWFRAFGTEIDTLARGGSPTPGPTRYAYLIELSWGGFGRWGLRRAFDPFFAFNPPRPREEYTRVGPALRRLIEVGLKA